jgi:hypothetical protein
MVRKSGKYRMKLANNHNLEELFDLPSSDSEDSVLPPQEQHSLPVTQDTLDTLDKIEQALPAVRGLEASDTEMDDLASKATESFDNLMDLGMQVDSRYASEIFAVAGAMLGHAITAKTAKMNKKLKMIQLQLQKAKLDQTNEPEEALPTAQGRVLNRNDLLRTLMTRDGESTDTNK